MKKEDESKIYQQLKNRFFFAGLVLNVVVLAAFYAAGWSIRLRDFSFQTVSSPGLANGVYLLVLFWGLYAIHFPLQLFTGFFWEHRFKLSNQKFRQWWADDLKKALISFVVVLLLVEALYFFLARFPGGWWVAGGLFWLFLNFLLTTLMPQAIIPLFYKYSSLEDQNLKKMIQALFQKCRLEIKDVYAVNFSAKTKKANAFVCGLGRSRRVVLSDTLLAQFTAEEIETVAAHELGHYRRQDMLKLLLVNSGVVFAGFFLMDRFLPALGVSRMADIAYLPVVLLAFVIFGFLVTPFLNWFSCRLEREADRFSLQLTGRPGAFISMLDKLGRMNLSESNPGRLNEIFFYDHPPVAKRIAFAREWAEKDKQGKGLA
ncbi:MAG: M48 family metallopeptidase [Candidatus Omnitrophota bacterium]